MNFIELSLYELEIGLQPLSERRWKLKSPVALIGKGVSQSECRMIGAVSASSDNNIASGDARALMPLRVRIL